MDQRERMVLMWLSGHYTAADVAARFEVSRTTLYDWTARYRAEGRRGLVNRPPIAESCPHKTAAAIEDRVVAARRRYGWGWKKLREIAGRRPADPVAAALDDRRHSGAARADRAPAPAPTHVDAVSPQVRAARGERVDDCRFQRAVQNA